MVGLSSSIKIMLSGETGILTDELQYDGLLETIHILQENPAIVQSLAERENDEFVSEEELSTYRR